MTPLTLTNANQAYQFAEAAAVDGIPAKKLIVVLAPAATGPLYIGDSTLNPATPIGIIDVRSGDTGDKFELTEEDAPNGLNISDYYFASGNAGDVLYGAYYVQ